MRIKGIHAAITAAALLCAPAPAVFAQYPSVPGDIQRAADEAKRAADRRSDEAFAKAMPVIEEWAKKGKPYLPGAAKPGPIATINHLDPIVQINKTFLSQIIIHHDRS